MSTLATREATDEIFNAYQILNQMLVQFHTGDECKIGGHF